MSGPLLPDHWSPPGGAPTPEQILDAMRDGMGGGVERESLVLLKEGTPEWNEYRDFLARKRYEWVERTNYLGETVSNNVRASRPKPGGFAAPEFNNYNLMALPLNPYITEVPTPEDGTAES